MTDLGKLIVAFVRTCSRFGLILQVADGVLYLHDPNTGRLGYITSDLVPAFGINRRSDLNNALGLMHAIARKHDFIYDFGHSGVIAFHDSRLTAVLPL